MRIGLVLPETPGYSETFFNNKISVLKKEGYEIILFVPKYDKKFKQCKVVKNFNISNNYFNNIINIVRALILCFLNFIPVVKLFKLNKHSGFALRRNLLSIFVSSSFLGKKYDWIHFGYATMAINRENIVSILGAKLAVSIRGYDIVTFPLKYKNIYSLLWLRVDKLHYISDFTLDMAIKHGFPINKDKEKIYPAIDINKFNYVKKIYFTKSKKISITTVARLHWIKSLDHVLSALKIVKEYGIKFEYTIIGEGNELEKLIYLKSMLGLEENVFLVGKLTSSEIIEKLKLTDLYIQYSLDEGFCNSVLEAQAMSCLCIVSNAKGLSENIIDNKTGYVVEKMNASILADTIIKIFELDNENLNSILDNAYRRSIQYFDLNVQADKFKKFYITN